VFVCVPYLIYIYGNFSQINNLKKNTKNMYKSPGERLFSRYTQSLFFCTEMYEREIYICVCVCSFQLCFFLLILIYVLPSYYLFICFVITSIIHTLIFFFVFAFFWVCPLMLIYWLFSRMFFVCVCKCSKYIYYE
jgi:hypothetical protein